jgi:hypothetical protein
MFRLVASVDKVLLYKELGISKATTSNSLTGTPTLTDAPLAPHVIAYLTMSRQELPHPPGSWVENPVDLPSSFSGVYASFVEEGHRVLMPNLGRIPGRHSRHQWRPRLQAQGPRRDYHPIVPITGKHKERKNGR